LFLKQDKLTTLRTKSSYGVLGGIVFSRLKIFARSLLTMIDHVSGLKLVKSEQFA